jgi:hypothetical protein
VSEKSLTVRGVTDRPPPTRELSQVEIFERRAATAFSVQDFSGARNHELP